MISQLKRVRVNNKNEYYNFKAKGFEPLSLLIFDLDFDLRLQLQKEFFGSQSPENDHKFYKYAFKIKPNICNETDKPLRFYNASFVSHILTKGAFTEMRYDLRNVELLTLEMHNKWEYSELKEKSKMKIFYKNQKIINILKTEYNVKY